MTIDGENPRALSASQRALIALREMRSKLDAIERAKAEPIAIIGMGCRFPGGVSTPEEYWQLLQDGIDAVTPIPNDRWDHDAYFDADPDSRGKTHVAHASVLDSVDQFDPEFFGITPREARSMDPQQRLLLEVTWEAIERSGHAPSELFGTKTGIYIGISTNDYGMAMNKADPATLDPLYSATGSAFCIASGRVSYALGLRGPNLAIDTACSSSLVAMHLACQDLRAGKSELAVAGGVNLMLSPETFITLSAIGAIAPDGRCKTFSAEADGYGRGEGCGMIVLKRLSDAVADGDNVLAVIRGSAINHDGRTSGLTVPSAAAQKAVVQDALKDGLVDALEVDYVEAHGTGTELGDPIEVRALVDVLCDGRSTEHPLTIGAVKTNIGHLEAAAGVAGLIKVVLSLQHQAIPRHLHFDHPSTHIPWNDIPVTVPTGQLPWAVGQGVRTGGVSAFGLSGTNAHVVLSEAPPLESVDVAAEISPTERPVHILCLSARSESALSNLVTAYDKHLATAEPNALADVCFTANAGRSHFNHRVALLGDSVTAMRSQLGSYSTGRSEPEIVAGTCNSVEQRRAAFLFTGQGSQYIGMGRDLYESEPVFREMLDRCSEILEPVIECSLLSVIFADSDDESALDQTAYTQPALFAVEYALASLYRTWGIEPTVVAGHSVGEYVAACIAGVFSLEDGLKLVAIRGRLMQELQSDGDMAAVFADEQRVLAAIEDHGELVSIAALNGPQNTVISGDRNALGKILQQLEKDGINAQRLTVSHAFHSPLMGPMVAAFREVARSVEYHPPRMSLVSNVTGQAWGANEIPDADYWCRHILAPVRFEESVAKICEGGNKLILEVGPHPTLIGMATYDRPADDSVWIPSLRRDHGDWSQLLTSLGQLFVHGVKVDWEAFDRAYSRRRVILPTYPFQRRRYWAPESDTVVSRLPVAAAARGALHPLLGNKLRSASSESVFEGVLDLNTIAYLNDHCFYGMPVFPAAAYVEIALSAAGLSGIEDAEIEDLALFEAMILDRDQPTVVQIIVGQERSDVSEFSICSISAAGYDADGKWQTHASGKLRRQDSTDAPLAAVGDIRERCGEEVPAQTLYDRGRELGVDYGPTFQGMQKVWRTDGEAFADISLHPELVADSDGYRLHPTLLDAGFQVMGAALAGMAGGDAYMPIGIGRQRVLTQPPSEMYVHAVVRRFDGPEPDLIEGDVQLLGADGTLVSETSNLQFKRVNKQTLIRYQEVNAADWLYHVEWQPSPLKVEVKNGTGSWIVFADDSGVGAELAEWLGRRGDVCTSVTRGDNYERVDDNHVSINPAVREDMSRLLTETEKTGAPALRGIIYLWALDSNVSDATPVDDLNDDAEQIHSGALYLLHALAELAGMDLPQLWLVTRGAQTIGGQTAPCSPVQSTLWGLGAVIELEHPLLRCGRMDLDPRADNATTAQELGAEICADGPEDQVALRAGSRYVARLVRDGADRGGAAADLDLRKPFQLDIAERGLLDSLRFVPLTRAEPAAGEVEIEILATALNFRDVLNALGTYAGEPGPLGNECAGRVTAIGSGVNDLAIGDDVVALAANTFSSHVTTDARFVVRISDNLSPAEAATIPVTFLTSDYALCHCAALKKGQRVLIHAAAGGVGMAAVQIAQCVGAEIFATAGSPRKRELLRSLGIEHVMDSRSLDFADEIMEITKGAGVDVILNSLNGEFIPKSLAVLAKGGHFLEIGKAGIWTQEELAESRPDVRYDIIFLGGSIQEEPELIRDRFNGLMKCMERGTLKPLPRHDFPMTKVIDAFRFMAAAKHVGKVVVYRDRDDHAILASESPDSEILDEEGTYLVTGGLGGLGLQVAERLATNGAKYLMLFGRSAPGEMAVERIEELRREGVQVHLEQGDVSSVADVSRIMKNVQATMPALRGVVHCAGLLDDGVLVEQTWSRFAKVMAPKIAGSWNLHRATMNADLQFFVMFSSIASMLGSAGQGNYVAANAFLDALAEYRRSSGLPGLALNWGAWSEMGMAALGGERIDARRVKYGAGEIVPKHGQHVFSALLFRDCAQMGILPMNWGDYFSAVGSAYPPLLAAMAKESKATTRTAAPAAEFLQRLEDVPASERAELVSNFVRDSIARVFSLDDLPDPQQKLTEIGMDSLLAVELKNQFERELGVAVSMATLLKGSTVAEVGTLMLGKLTGPDQLRATSAVTIESHDWEVGEL